MSYNTLLDLYQATHLWLKSGAIYNQYLQNCFPLVVRQCFQLFLCAANKGHFASSVLLELPVAYGSELKKCVKVSDDKLFLSYQLGILYVCFFSCSYIKRNLCDYCWSLQVMWIPFLATLWKSFFSWSTSWTRQNWVIWLTMIPACSARMLALRWVIFFTINL